MIGIWASILLTLIAVVLFAMDILAMELVAVGIIVVGLLLAVILPELGVTFPEPEALFTGFASPALITIMALLVVGQALFRTGALTGIVDRLLQSGHGIPRSVLIMLALVVAMIVSAFMNNTPVTVVFIPILVGLMRGIMPASRHMRSEEHTSELQSQR
jgi:di/tricarboxylate transporter